jgi:putative salt-induced outer membrane protein YdiY
MNSTGSHSFTRLAISLIFVFALAVRAEDTGWQSKAALGLNAAAGNSESILVNVELSTARTVDENSYKCSLLLARGEADKTVSEENGKLSARYDRAVSEMAYLYLGGDVDFDTIANIDYRIIAGPGAGYSLIKNETHELSIEAGLSYRTERITTDVAVTDDAVVIRLAQSYARKLSDNAKLWQTIEFMPDSDNLDAFLLNAEVGIEATVNDNLSLRVTAQDRYNSAPPEETKENDISVKASLVYNIGK